MPKVPNGQLGTMKIAKGADGNNSLPPSLRAEQNITYSVLGFNEWVVDSNDINVTVQNGISKDDTANTTKSIRRLASPPSSKSRVAVPVDSSLDGCHIQSFTGNVIEVSLVYLIEEVQTKPSLK